VTLQLAREHGHSTAFAMHPSSVAPWLEGAESHEIVSIEVCYIVPGVLIEGGVSRRSRKVDAKYRSSRASGGQEIQCAHIEVELAFGALDERLTEVDKWPSQSRG
jgi:hypothetical protein